LRGRGELVKCAGSLASRLIRQPPGNGLIQALWIGPRLSVLERLSLTSFLRHGHAVHLYAYGEPEGVPDGVEIRDAAEILPASRIFRYRETGSFAGFANFFRYKLLLQKGGWYVDSDVVCLRPFDFPTPYVFAYEPGDTTPNVCNAIIKTPRASRIMRRAWRACRRAVPAQLRWGETGSELMTRELNQCSLLGYVRDPEVFCPVHFADWSVVLDPRRRPELSPSTYAIHLWNEMWRRNGQEKDAEYEPACLYEELKRQYL